MPELISRDFYVKMRNKGIEMFYYRKSFYRALVSVSSLVTKQIDGSDRLVMSL